MNSSPVSLHIGPFKPFLHGRSLFANPLALRFSLFACFILLACKCHAATPNTHSSELLSPQEGDRIALEIRYGIIDRNTLRGAERWQRLDQAIKETDTLADAFFADQQLVPEQYRRLIDRMIALAARHRALDTVTLYESFVQQNRAVPA
ncbi:MAG: hypothetical protein KA902_05700 [Arenimonas sp.]|nr:hypothetical protein [Arenimonas sp.]